MNSDVILGTVLLIYGLGTLMLRFIKPEAFWRKLGPMKEKFGDKAGTAIHWVAYTIVPLVAGAVMLLRGLAK